MANDEHVGMLARGAAAWNEWRANRDETPDLSRAGLRGLDLSGFDLSRADLRGADLRGTNLSGANVSSPGTGNRLFVMTRLPVARPFQTANHQNKPPRAEMK
jgi:hypothetical protein